MTKINWLSKLGWTREQIEDLRYTGYSYVKQGKYAIALSFFEALVLLDPKSAYDKQTLGAIYLELNQIPQALDYFEQALQIEKNHAPTLLNLAKAFFTLGKKNEGLKFAHILKNNENTFIANTAKALILAYDETE
jgi:tetratricopeptide (TPR) repeat protein